MRALATGENAGFVSHHLAHAARPERHLKLAATKSGSERHQIRLTPRQRDVLALLCEGLPNKLICRRLNISAGTVKAHISSILRELGVASRLQAVVRARESGVLEAEYEAAE
jgi:DNA-binding NarL/FixJ family response regulator